MADEKETLKKPDPLTEKEVEELTTLVCAAFAKATEDPPEEIRGALVVAALTSPTFFGGTTSPVRAEVRYCVARRLHEWGKKVLEASAKGDDDGA